MLGSAHRRRCGGLRRRPPAQRGTARPEPTPACGLATPRPILRWACGRRSLAIPGGAEAGGRPGHLHPSMAEVVGLAICFDDLARNAW